MKTVAHIRVAHALPEADAASRIFSRRNLSSRVHALGTEVEGDLHSVLSAVEEIHDDLRRRGATRVSTSITLVSDGDDVPEHAAAAE